MTAQNKEVDKVNHQLTEDNGKLIPRHQCSANVARSDFGNVHRTNGGSQPHTYTAQDTVEIESHQKRIGRNAMLKEQEFGIIGTQRRQEEQDTCQKERVFTAQSGCKKSGNGATYDTAYQCAG